PVCSHIPDQAPRRGSCARAIAIPPRRLNSTFAGNPPDFDLIYQEGRVSQFNVKLPSWLGSHRFAEQSRLWVELAAQPRGRGECEAQGQSAPTRGGERGRDTVAQQGRAEPVRHYEGTFFGDE